MRPTSSRRSPSSRRIRFILSRAARTVIGYLITMFVLSALINTTMEVSVRSQIVETAQAAVMGKPGFKSAEEVLLYKQEIIAGLERSYGLDKPRLVRIARMTANVITLDLGDSRVAETRWPERSRKVKRIIAERLPPTLILFTSSTAISVLLGLRLGMAMARRPAGLVSKTSSVLTMIIYGTPSWWVASFMMLFFVYKIPIFKAGALCSPDAPTELIPRVLDYLSYLLLPLLTLVTLKTWGFAYLTRSMVVVPLQDDFVYAARGRGIPERKVLRRHGLRVAAPGLATMATQAFAQSLVGDILLEKVLSRPGLGSTLFTAITANDVPLIIGILGALTLIYLVSYFFLDIVYALLDPRIGSGAASAT